MTTIVAKHTPGYIEISGLPATKLSALPEPVIRLTVWGPRGSEQSIVLLTPDEARAFAQAIIETAADVQIAAGKAAIEAKQRT